jgi:hypothetical protein
MFTLELGNLESKGRKSFKRRIWRMEKMSVKGIRCSRIEKRVQRKERSSC